MTFSSLLHWRSNLSALYFLVVPDPGVVAYIMLALLLYLVIPIVPGMLSIRQTGNVHAGCGAGLAFGLSCALIVTVTICITMSFATSTGSGRMYLPAGLLQSLLVIATILLNGVGVLLAVLGGSIGRAIGKRWAETQ